MDLPVEVSHRQVLRLLGYRRARAPRPQVGERLDVLWPQALGLMRPCGTHRLVCEHQAAATGMPQPTTRVGLGLCTVGPRLEARVAELSAAGQTLDALLLDAIGSAAAEATADVLDRRVAEAAAAEGLQAGKRISPGYGAWPVERQADLLAYLDAEVLGVRLTAGAMMVPRKSVSFAVRLGPGAGRGEDHCADCAEAGCAYREGLESP